MAKRQISRGKMKLISEAYERIQAIESDISDIQFTAERVIDNSTSVWISLDLQDDLIQEIHTTGWSTSTSSGSFFLSTEARADTEDKGLSLNIPDTIALEVLGVILRHKQQLIENENNNI